MSSKLVHFANQTWSEPTAKVDSLPGLLAAGWRDLHAIIAVLTVLSTSPSKIEDLTPKILSFHSTVIFRLTA